MTWLKLDDGFAEHDKILPLTDKAFRLHVVGMLACARNLTDGFVSDSRFISVAATARSTRKHATELEQVGLWQRVEAGWRVRDYLDYNPSAEKVREERAKTIERKRRWEERRAQNTSDDPPENGVPNGVPNASENRSTDGVTNAAPSRPVPSRSKEPFLPSPPTDGTDGRNINLEQILKDAS